MTAAEALVRLEELCARSEQCTFELRQKLSRWSIPPTEAAQIIEALVQRRYADDSRYASAYVRDKYRFARWGRRKIANGLYTKRIPREIIGQALDRDIDSDEYADILRDLLHAKARSITEGNTYAGRTRLFRFAASRGFETELIVKCIRSEAASLWPRQDTEA